VWSVALRVNELTIGADRRTNAFAVDRKIFPKTTVPQLRHAEAHAAFGGML